MESFLVENETLRAPLLKGWVLSQASGQESVTGDPERGKALAYTLLSKPFGFAASESYSIRTGSGSQDWSVTESKHSADQLGCECSSERTRPQPRASPAASLVMSVNKNSVADTVLGNWYFQRVAYNEATLWYNWRKHPPLKHDRK